MTILETKKMGAAVEQSSTKANSSKASKKCTSTRKKVAKSNPQANRKLSTEEVLTRKTKLSSLPVGLFVPEGFEPVGGDGKWMDEDDFAQSIILAHAAITPTDWSDLKAMLEKAVFEDHLLCDIWEGEIVSGFGCNDRVRSALQKIPPLNRFFQNIEKNFDVVSVWTTLSTSGTMKHHRAKSFKGNATYRAVLSLGCTSKTFTVSERHDEDICRSVTFKVPHQGIIFLSQKGGGVVGDWYHEVDGAMNSYTIAFELYEKK